jgi:formyl-CoA transferase
MRFSATPVAYELPPPLLGQHTREVLGAVLGLSAAELDDLAALGVI